jgi:hypothetical protein
MLLDRNDKLSPRIPVESYAMISSLTPGDGDG